jgi:hypothetical protein
MTARKAWSAAAQSADGANCRRKGCGNAAEVYVPMRDFIADWKKWSRAERVLAVVVTSLMAALPIGLALASAGGA